MAFAVRDPNDVFRIIQLDPTDPPPVQSGVGYTNGAIWYNISSNVYQGIESGSVVTFSTGGGGGNATVATVNSTGNSASIASTSLYAVTGSNGGMYAVYADVIVTTAGSAGTVTTTVAWNNGTTAASLVSSAFSLAATGEQAALLGNFYVPAGQSVTYSTTVTGAAGGPVYALRLRLVYLG
jgi:hypothetical protein